MVEALVEFDYFAQAPDELSLKKGDVITAIVKEPGNGWWEGSLKGHRGLFPDNFVKVIIKEGPGDTGKDEKNGVVFRPGSKRRCRVIFSYKPVNEDELELKVNDLIEVLAEVEEGWWRGKLRNKVGVFPSNFVQEEVLTGSLPGDTSEKSVPKSKPDSKRLSIPNVEETLNASPEEEQNPVVEALSVESEAGVPSLPPKPAKEYCRALFPYEAANEDELTLSKGDIILIMSKVVQDKGWWKGELKGKIGVFPDNFVEVVPADVATKKMDRQPQVGSGGTSAGEAGGKAVSKTEPFHQPEAQLSSQTEPMESPSKEDKPQVPPIPGKKPQLPPPLKKPQRLPPGHPPSVQPSSASATSSLSAKKRISGEFEGWGGSGDSTDGAKMSFMSKSNSNATPISAVRLRRIDGPPLSPPAMLDSVGNPPPTGEMDFDSVERSAMLSHPTASRAKAPRRRPPSAMFPCKESEGGLMNGTVESEETIVEAPRTHVENGATSVEDSSREPDDMATANGGSEEIREKKSPAGAASRPPFMDELKMSQAKRGTTVVGVARPVVNPPSTVQVGSSGATPTRPPVQPSLANPYPPHVHQAGELSEKAGHLKQRPFHSKAEEVDASSSLPSSAVGPSIPPLPREGVSPMKPPRRGRKSVENGGCSVSEVSDGDGDMVMEESYGAGRPASGIAGASQVTVSPPIGDAAPSVSQPSSVAADSSASLGGSNRTSSGDGPTPTALMRRPVSAHVGDVPSHRRVAAHFTSWQEPVPDGDSITVTPQMYKELRERVELLEQSLESQSERFTQMLNHLREELIQERERRKALQDSVNQLQNLLTHV